jgi:hypothetical protein
MRGCINAGYSCSSSTTTLRYQCRLYHYRHRVLDIHCLPLMIDATSCRTLPLIATGHHHGGGPRSDGMLLSGMLLNCMCCPVRGHSSW